MPSCLILDAEMQCSLPVLESLRKRGFQVTAASYKRINMGFFSRYPHHRLLYPDPKKFSQAFVDRILTLIQQHRYDFILPTDDVSTEMLLAVKDRLEPYTRFPVVSYETFMKARDKAKTLKIAIENGVPCPKTLFPDEENIDSIADRVVFPVLVKPNISSGARGISLVHNKTELRNTYNDIKKTYGECHIQEFIPKGGLQYKADLFLDTKQELKAGIVYSKLRYFPVNGGSSVINRTELKPEILENAHRILKAMGWYGFADFDFITDPRDGIAKIMEINPRVPACFRITRAAGIDFSHLIAKLALNQEIPRITEYKLNVYLRYFPLDVLWFLQSPDRFVAEPSFFKFFGSNLHDQIISLRDPGPIFGFCLENMLALFNLDSRKTRYSRGW